MCRYRFLLTRVHHRVIVTRIVGLVSWKVVIKLLHCFVSFVVLTSHTLSSKILLEVRNLRAVICGVGRPCAPIVLTADRNIDFLVSWLRMVRVTFLVLKIYEVRLVKVTSLVLEIEVMNWIDGSGSTHLLFSRNHVILIRYLELLCCISTIKSWRIIDKPPCFPNSIFLNWQGNILSLILRIDCSFIWIIASYHILLAHVLVISLIITHNYAVLNLI